jgi:hypothetical protein
MRLSITGISSKPRIPVEQTLVGRLEYWRRRLPARSR